MFWIFVCEACEILTPWSEMEPMPHALEGEIFTTGHQGGPYIRDFWLDSSHNWISQFLKMHIFIYIK